MVSEAGSSVALTCGSTVLAPARPVPRRDDPLAAIKGVVPRAGNPLPREEMMVDFRRGVK
jgi:hypothetical protein